MRVLVTGATGFVGACLTRRLVEAGHELHVVTRRDSDRWRIVDLGGRLTDHCCDLRDLAATESCVAAASPEVVCHLATYGGFATQQGGREIVEANLLGTMNLVQSCEKSGVRLIVNTGSSSEYGPQDHPMREDDLPAPLGDYGVTKLAATLFCQSEALTKGVPVVTLRLFSPYGPWDDPRRLIPYAAASLLAGEPPQLASPDAVRDYVYIDDVLDCYQMLVEGTVRPAAGIYNVGSGCQSSIGEVVAELERLCGNGVASRWGERSAARPEPGCWVADIARARDQLGWQPQVSLHQGLARTVAWLGRHLHLYRRR